MSTELTEMKQFDASLHNVILSATHTHSGQGGYSHYTLYNLTVLGYNKPNFDVIVDGIAKSIIKAHDNLRPGDIKIIEKEKGEV